jgi:hypothetical protein
MLNLFGLVIRTKKEEEDIMDDILTLCEQNREIGRHIEEIDTKIKLSLLRDDIMCLDADAYTLNEVMNLIDKNFGEEDISEKEKTKTVDIKFGGF